MNNLKRKKNWLRLGWLLFYLYIAVLSYFLFFSKRYGREVNMDYGYNLEFMKEIKRFIQYRNLIGFEGYVLNIIGNVVAFSPFGFFLPLLDKKYRKFIYILFLSILFSLSVELIQLKFKVGVFDVDDIFMNTIGGIFGYLFFMICHGIYRKFFRGRT